MQEAVGAGQRREAVLDADSQPGREAQGPAEVRDADVAPRALREPARGVGQQPRRLRAPEPPVVAAREEPVAHLRARGVQLVREVPEQRRAAPVGLALQQPRAQPEAVDLRRQRGH
ncbi:MAG TPA: hypothetical protein VH418_04315, partial [Solirubrobacteraceae bacterium]